MFKMNDTDLKIKIIFESIINYTKTTLNNIKILIVFKCIMIVYIFQQILEI